MRTSSLACCVFVFLGVAGFALTACGSSGGSDNGLPAGTVLEPFTRDGGGSRLVPFGREPISARVLEKAQTFVITRTGNIVGLDYIAGGVNSDLIIRIMPAPGGVIDEDNNNALSTTRILEANVQPPGFGSFLRFTGSGIPVTQGDELAITFEFATGEGQIKESSSAYVDGTSFERDNQGITLWTPAASNADLVFGIYVAP